MAQPRWLGSSCDAVDLDQRMAREPVHADAGPCRQAILRKIGTIDLVHRAVVAIEMEEEGAYRHDVLEPETRALQHQEKVIHHAAGLGLDTGGQRCAVV